MFVFDILFLLVLLLYLRFPKREVESSLTVPKINADALKAILPLGIIIFHFYFPFVGNTTGSMIVGCFFFMSGYGLMHKSQKYNGITWKELSKSVAKVAAPWLFMILVFQAVKLVRTGHLYLNTTMSLLSDGYLELLLPWSWFCPALMMLYLFVWLSCHFEKRWEKHVSLLLLLVFYSMMIWLLDWDRYWVDKLLSFWLGCFWFDYLRKIKINKYLIIVVSVILMVLNNALLMCDWDVGDKTALGFVIYMVVVAVGSACFVMLGTQVDAVKLFDNGIMLFLHKHFYWLYLCHGVSMFLLNPSKVAWGLPSGMNNTVLIIIAQYATTIVLSVLCRGFYKLIQKCYVNVRGLNHSA